MGLFRLITPPAWDPDSESCTLGFRDGILRVFQAFLRNTVLLVCLFLYFSDGWYEEGTAPSPTWARCWHHGALGRAASPWLVGPVPRCPHSGASVLLGGSGEWRWLRADGCPEEGAVLFKPVN